MQATCWKRCDFEAAHFLPDYKGACSRLHGHTYTVEIGVTGAIDLTTGMVVDLKDISEWLKLHILGALDHRYLNDTLRMPTAENLALEILKYARLEWPKFDLTVRLYETRDSWVEVFDLAKVRPLNG